MKTLPSPLPTQPPKTLDLSRPPPPTVPNSLNSHHDLSLDRDLRHHDANNNLLQIQLAVLLGFAERKMKNWVNIGRFPIFSRIRKDVCCLLTHILKVWSLSPLLLSPGVPRGCFCVRGWDPGLHNLECSKDELWLGGVHRYPTSKSREEIWCVQLLKPLRHGGSWSLLHRPFTNNSSMEHHLAVVRTTSVDLLCEMTKSSNSNLFTLNKCFWYGCSMPLIHCSLQWLKHMKMKHKSQYPLNNLRSFSGISDHVGACWYPLHDGYLVLLYQCLLYCHCITSMIILNVFLHKILYVILSLSIILSTFSFIYGISCLLYLEFMKNRLILWSNLYVYVILTPDLVSLYMTLHTAEGGWTRPCWNMRLFQDEKMPQKNKTSLNKQKLKSGVGFQADKPALCETHKQRNKSGFGFQANKPAHWSLLSGIWNPFWIHQQFRKLNQKWAYWTPNNYYLCILIHVSQIPCTRTLKQDVNNGKCLWTLVLLKLCT